MIVKAQEAQVVEVEPGIRRQILGYDAQLMLVRVTLDAGAIARLHSHPHRQVTYVESGAFEATVNDRTMVISSGDCYFVPPNVPHGVRTIAAGVLIDVFTPAREDFVDTLASGDASRRVQR